MFHYKPSMYPNLWNPPYGLFEWEVYTGFISEVREVAGIQRAEFPSSSEPGTSLDEHKKRYHTSTYISMVVGDIMKHLNLVIGLNSRWYHKHGLHHHHHHQHHHHHHNHHHFHHNHHNHHHHPKHILYPLANPLSETGPFKSHHLQLLGPRKKMPSTTGSYKEMWNGIILI